MTEELSFRAFRAGDLPECARFTAETWTIVGTLEKGGRVLPVVRGYLELSLNTATWKEVVCLSGRVIGFLFGRIESDVGLPQIIAELLGSVRILARFILGRYGRFRDIPLFLRKLSGTNAKVAEFSPPSAGTVELFVIDPAFTGKGVGRALLDRFTNAVSERGGGNEKEEDGGYLVSLYTDPLSNWHFYEKCGFARIAAFPDDLNTLLTGKKTEGYIYALPFHVPEEVHDEKARY